MFGAQRNWNVRAAAIGGVVLIHAIVIFSILQRRAEHHTEQGSRAMFSAIISQIGEHNQGGLARKPQPAQTPAQTPPDDTAVPDARWRFEPADIWPSHVKAVQSTELSSFTGTSATPLQPLAPPPGSNNHRIAVTSTLRMLRWMRPDYSPTFASAGEEGTAQLELHVDESGKALEIKITQGTGFASLDQAALQAAQVWTFSPPLNHGQPVRTWAEIEIRFHAE